MEKKLELENMLVGHFIGSIPDDCEKPVSYVMCGDGMWEIRKNSLGTFRRKSSKTKIPGLPCIFEEGFELSIPKAPLSLLWQAVAFFREIYRIHQSEAALRLVYDRKTNRYSFDCPQQEVSMARCEFDRRKTLGQSVIVAEIHSHGQIAASFSGTDDKDEIADRFYGVVGKVLDFFPEVNFRLAIGGNHMPIGIEELFAVENDPMLKAQFPSKWLDQVKKKELVRIQQKGKKFLNETNEPGKNLSWDFVMDKELKDITDEEFNQWEKEFEEWKNSGR